MITLGAVRVRHGGKARHELERIVASDYSRAQISIKLQSAARTSCSRKSNGRMLWRSRRLRHRNQRHDHGVGPFVHALDHPRHVANEQLAAAFFTVFGVIFVVFRSARFGLLTIVPNVLPVLAVLGVMGYLDISMNIATVMVASIALGVVDDDTIHFINRYRREIAAGASTDEAIQLATIHEGRAR